MKASILTEKYGEIILEESFWTNSKKISVNGVPLKKINKKTYVDNIGQAQITAVISGGFISGAVIDINGEKFRLTEGAKWYDYVFTFMWVAIYIAWSAIPQLYMTFPVVGGAIGGVVAGIAAAGTIYIIKPMKNIAAKFAVSLGIFVGMMLVNFALAMVILTAII